MLQYAITILWGIILLYYIFIFSKGNSSSFKKLYILIPLTLLLTFIFFLNKTFYLRSFPITHLSDIFLTLSFMIGVGYFVIEKILHSQNLGFIVIGCIFILNVCSHFFSNLHDFTSIFSSSTLLASHITFAIIAYSIFIFGAIFGLLYLLLFHVLKKRKFGMIYAKFPSLEILDEINYKSSIIGFIVLTLALIIGYIWKSLIHDQNFTLDVKIYITLLIWCFFGIHIVTLNLNSPKKRAYLSLVGSGLLLLSIIIGIFIKKLYHF